MMEKPVAYQVNGRAFEGMIVYDDSVSTKRPVIFEQPDWKGICRDTIDMAHRLAGRDYVVLMADMFGKDYGGGSKSRDDLGKGMRAVYTDLQFTLTCGETAYRALMDAAGGIAAADTSRNFAVGYCAGGGFVLEQCRAGADFKATAVFHVTNPNPVNPGTPCHYKGRVLAVHGRADPVTPKEKMDAFEAEMTAAHVDWQVMMFGPPAVHSFCDPTARNPGANMYDENLCRKSYMLMRDFFAETA